MSNHVFDTERRVKVRKEHPCFYCDEVIVKGEMHAVREGVSDGDFWRMRMHDECRKAAAGWDNYDYEGFEPGTMKRGVNEVQ